VNATYSLELFGAASTNIGVYWEARTIGNTSYVFSGDMNGDGGAGNDLIYIPKNTSEMNFSAFTLGNRTFTADEQAAAFEAYITQDKYLSKHRGEYATRGGVFYPMMRRMDLSIVQDVFGTAGGKKHAGQFRLDITNFGNLLNKNWGLGQRLVNNQILTNPTADANGALSYRMQLLNGSFISQSYQTSAGLSDVYTMMLSFRYRFD